MKAKSNTASARRKREERLTLARAELIIAAGWIAQHGVTDERLERLKEADAELTRMAGLVAQDWIR